MDELTLIGPPGTNKVMAGELSRLVRRALDGVRLATPRKDGSGVLCYPFDAEVAKVATTYHRTCSRVVRDLMTSDAARLEPLYEDLVARLPPPGEWYADGQSLSVRVSAVDRFAAGERQIVGTVKNALIDGARRHGADLRLDPDAPDLNVAVRMHGDAVRVGLDLGGAMHRRGYRAHGGAAPLRENLAAALVMLARHDSRREPLVDPMAGSGTIAIEAALMGRGAPVHVRSEAPALFADTQPIVVANELEPKLADLARHNARVAGAEIRVECGDFRDLTPADLPQGPGLILSNPPYGERVGDDVLGLYDDLRHWLRQFRGWRAGFLVANREFEEVMGMRPKMKKPMSVRPLNGYVYVYEL
jgi:23S rRNA G2445 N2-methylase RlmL